MITEANLSAINALTSRTIPQTPTSGFTADQVFQSILNTTSATTTREDATEAAVSTTESSSTDRPGLVSLLHELAGNSNPASVNEEQMFASVLYDRILNSMGEDVAEQYSALLDEKLLERTRADGFIYVEDAARAVLKELESSGALTTVEAETIHAQAFQAAQLDDHTTVLYDSRGDTKSIAPTATAMEKALDMLLKFDNGELTSGRMPLSYQQGNPVTFSGSSQSGTSIAEISGDFAGYSNSETFTSYGVRNGGRQAWRIPESGPEYANKLRIVFKDGHTVYVNDTSNNYRESDGFVFKPGIDDGGEGSNSTSTSHGGIFLHAPYGNNSQKATLYWS